jgi:hypothetical protein
MTPEEAADLVEQHRRAKERLVLVTENASRFATNHPSPAEMIRCRVGIGSGEYGSRGEAFYYVTQTAGAIADKLQMLVDECLAEVKAIEDRFAPL